MADLQSLFAKVEGASVAVDLLKVSQSLAANGTNNGGNKPNHKLRLALDIEGCLDRFYGGYYSDWACGGQWNRAYQFVQLLVNAFDVANMEVIVFFDGSLHDRRRGQQADAKQTRQKTISVLKHIRMIGTPPPKIWWLPPSGIRTCIRNALRSLNVQVVQTVHDHTRELIDYYREHKLQGIIGLHADYIVAQPAHYYSSHDLRLSYKGTLETKEYSVARLLAHLEVTRAQLPYVAALLGSSGSGTGAHSLDAEAVRNIYMAIGVEYSADLEVRLKAMAKVVAGAPVGDVAVFVRHLKLDEWSTAIREAIEYYQKRERLVKEGSKQSLQSKSNKQKKAKAAKGAAAAAAAAAAASVPSAEDKHSDDGVSAEISSNNGNGADAAATADAAANASTALASEAGDHDEEFQRKLESVLNNLVEFNERDYTDMFEDLSLKTKDKAAIVPTSTLVTAPAAVAEIKPPASAVKSAKMVGAKAEKEFVYTLPSDVIKTAFNRHQRGMMDARLYQLLTKKEIVLTQALEDEQYRDVPSVHLFYRPARQMIYAILFNLNHQKYIQSKHTSNSGNGGGNRSKNTTATQQPPQVPNNSSSSGSNSAKSGASPTIEINEWLWSPQNEYQRPETVFATPLGWAVPTIQRLWFGTLFEDKQRRMKAFLSVMRSDAPLMLNRDYVPQHMLAMACVLRYIVTHPERTIVSRQELDAFLATAFSPHILNIEYTQELVLPCVYLRGVYLGTLFMQGVETASMANDACGVPLPWTMCNPWLFFDGKLFHLKLKAASCVQSLRELCDDHMELVLKIERFRKAILEDVEHFLLPSIIGNHSAGNSKQHYFNAGMQPMPANPYFGAPAQQQQLSNMDRRRSVQQQLVRQLRQQQHRNNEEYHLKVGGVVVGSWAGELPGRKPFNNGFAGGPLNQHRHQHNQQQQLQHQQQQQSQHHQQQMRQNYMPYGGDTNAGAYQNLQHHNQQQQQHPLRARSLNPSVYYNNMANRKRRGPGPFVNGGNGGAAGGIGGAGIAHRTIGRKSGGPLGACIAGGSGAGAEAKLAKNKARKQRTKTNKAAATASNKSADAAESVAKTAAEPTTTSAAAPAQQTAEI